MNTWCNVNFYLKSRNGWVTEWRKKRRGVGSFRIICCSFSFLPFQIFIDCEISSSRGKWWIAYVFNRRWFVVDELTALLTMRHKEKYMKMEKSKEKGGGERRGEREAGGGLLDQEEGRLGIIRPLLSRSHICPEPVEVVFSQLALSLIWDIGKEREREREREREGSGEGGRRE